MKKTANRYDALLFDMKEFADAMLAENPVVSVDDFEGRIGDKFRPTFTAIDKAPIAGGKRRRWENLVDWVKANLTMQNKITYVMVGEVRHIVFVPSVGIVNGTRLVDASQVNRVLGQLSMLGKSDRRKLAG